MPEATDEAPDAAAPDAAATDAAATDAGAIDAAAPAGRTGAVVLTAGAGRRLGGVAKALLVADDRTYLARVVATAAAAGVDAADVVVVVGAPFGDAVAAEARRCGARVVVNPAPDRGMASSVACGFAALAAAPAVDAAFLWPVDHPDVTAATLTALRRAGAGVPVHAGRGGHPPLVPRRLFAALAACAALPGGARDVVRALPRRAVDDPGVVADVDAPADLERRCS
ncbi:MAG: NTP transferase domain-containing protein [Myxococcales bacterium]|nr:NTP transferase domain-containing protein [Myxococcales bacterium]